MKALILWARSKHPEPYTLRMNQRDDDTVTGVVKLDNRWLPFTFDRHALEIRIDEDGAPRIIRINEWGWEL